MENERIGLKGNEEQSEGSEFGLKETLPEINTSSLASKGNEQQSDGSELGLKETVSKGNEEQSEGSELGLKATMPEINTSSLASSAKSADSNNVSDTHGAYRGDPATIQKFKHCLPGTPAYNEMQRLFPDADESEIVRFLIARKGVVEHSSSMLRAARQWHSANFPSKLKEIIPALKTCCIFAHGQALDGTPALYFRSALYDSKAATPMQYTLAAAYVIDTVLAITNQPAVTVIVCVAQVPGAPNEGADLNFIKSFIKVLSDNYPERLRRLVLYPFPLFGRVVWSIVKHFVDKRSQEKVVLLPGDGDGNLPGQLMDYVDRRAIPQCCGGLDLCAVEDTMADMIARANDASLITAGGEGSSSSVRGSGCGADDEAKLDADLLAKDMKLLGLSEDNP